MDKFCIMGITSHKWRVWKHLYVLEKTANRTAKVLVEVMGKKGVVTKKVFGRWAVLYWE